MPGNPVGAPRHLLIPTRLHLHPHLHPLTPGHNLIPTHTTTTDQNQVRFSIPIRDLPEGTDKGIQWQSMIVSRECRAFGEPCRFLG